MPECGYCKDCKWWDEDGQLDEWGDFSGLQEGWGLCHLTHTDAYDTVHPQSLAIATDSDAGWRAILQSTANFGCIQFEPKEAKDKT